MERLARFVVRHRRLVLFVAVLLLIPSLLGAIGTYINYDILTYLPAELDSMIGEVALEDDFHLASTGMIPFASSFAMFTAGRACCFSRVWTCCQIAFSMITG